jgi:photosystem II stability/assembly factor-like uncharacterized protein
MRVWLRGALVLALTMILNGLPTLAQDWQELGPNGGDVRAMVADPANPDVLYLGTVDGHIFSSQDAGQHWHLTGRVGDRADTVVMAIIVDRRDSHHLYAATRTLGENGGGVFRSDDGGATWRPSGLAGQAVRALIQTESDTGLFFAGTLDGVYRSHDNGARWDRISPANHADLRNFDSLLADPRNPEILYAGTYHLPWKTLDGGQHWQPVTAGMVDDSDVMSITMDPANPDRVYASACSGIYHSDNGGTKWSKYGGIPFLSRRTQIIRQDPTNPSIVYAGTTDGLWKTTNAGATWARVSVPNWTISALLLEARRPGRIILGVEGLGVYVTRDAGAKFLAINEGFSHRQVRELVTDPQQPARMLLVLTNAVESIYATNDSGRTWSAIGHNASTQTLRHVYAAPEPASGWWATPQSGGLLRYDATRATWVQTGVLVARPAAPAARTTKTSATAKSASASSAKTSAPANPAASARASAFSKPLRSQVYDLAFSGNLWVAATSEGLIASRDHGATWSEFDSYGKTSSTPHATVRFVHISADGQSFWVLGDSGLTISRDAGASWANADPSLRAKDVDKLVIASADTLFAIRTNGSLISNDGGLTWRSLNLPDTQVADVAVEGNEWLVSTRRHGLFVSANKGQSWKQLSGQLGEGNFPTLAAGLSSRLVLAASSTEGLFSLRVPLAGASASVQITPGGNQPQQR